MRTSSSGRCFSTIASTSENAVVSLCSSSLRRTNSTEKCPVGCFAACPSATRRSARTIASRTASGLLFAISVRSKGKYLNIALRREEWDGTLRQIQGREGCPAASHQEGSRADQHQAGVLAHHPGLRKRREPTPLPHAKGV